MNGRQQKEIVWWVVWAAFLVGVIQVYVLLGGKTPPAKANSNLALLGIVPFVLSGIVRWVVLPKAQNGQAAIAFFIVGLALAEASCLLGLFVFPAYKLELFILSLLGILQFAPTFAGRYRT